MDKNVLYVGVDVDDKSFHGCGFNRETGEFMEFVCKPDAGHLAEKLDQFQKKGFTVKMCYEATYLGYSLHRAMTKRGYSCDVIAPSLIPGQTGKRVKTDRLDCKKLAEYYANNQLTKIYVPSVEDEAVRSLVRARKFLTKQKTALKAFILALCRCADMNYREEAGNSKNYWTGQHRAWLDKKVKDIPDRIQALNLDMLLQQMDHIESQIELYDTEIGKVAQSDAYCERVKALYCYRGIETLTAMTLITELGDIKRFSHPRQLCSYAGMELIEYSSGGHERRYRMSKMGNARLRTSVVEACQLSSSPPKVSKILKARRKGMNTRYVEIADKCMHRLYKKSQRLLHRGKIVNKVKVACARELLCFVWESLRAVSA